MQAVAVNKSDSCIWAARYNTWLLIKLTSKGVVFSFLFSDSCCVQDLVQQRGRFCSSQQSRIDELMQFVNQQRLKRKQVNLRHLIDA